MNTELVALLTVGIWLAVLVTLILAARALIVVIPAKLQTLIDLQQAAADGNTKSPAATPPAPRPLPPKPKPLKSDGDDGAEAAALDALLRAK